MKGTIFNVQKCSIHDGPGLRTTVFLKGCHMHCKWCANPESQCVKGQHMEFPARCIGCGKCIATCPEHAISMRDGRICTDRNKCDECGICTVTCYANARNMVGEEITPEGLYERIEKDVVFYENSEGGVTVSGGEPLLQPEFVHAFLALCRKRGIHTAMETCAFAEYDKFRIVKDDLDFLYMDIKLLNRKKHREYTGVEPQYILDNIRKIDQWNVPFVIRTPVIPGINDTVGEIREIASFCKTLTNIQEYELLAYHRLGIGKYHALGRSYELENTPVPSVEHMTELVQAANKVLQEAKFSCVYRR